MVWGDEPRHMVPVEAPVDTFKAAVEFGAVVAQNYEIALLAYGFAITSPASPDIARCLRCNEMYGNDTADYDWRRSGEGEVLPESFYTGYWR